jgi:RsiW-degrading membrane proteinase PrsW (M82 family)
MTTEQPALTEKPRLQLSRSTVFPLVGSRAAWKQEHLLPIFATLVVGLALLLLLQPSAELNRDDQLSRAWKVYWIIGVYIAFLANCYINEMCMRARHLWLLAVVAITTCVLLETVVFKYWYHFFHVVIPAAKWLKSDSATMQLVGWFVAAGLNEESFKALPLFALVVLGGGLAFLGRHAKGALGRVLGAVARQIGLFEPLDGIVLGVASGTGFFVNETLGQYVPDTMAEVHGSGSQAFEGLVLLLSRGLPELAEHSAWSGLFGYFIGLAVLRPSRAFFLLPIGWFSAAALHGAWDGIGVLTDSDAVVIGFLIFLGLFGYALMFGAIFKAREISPRFGATGARLDDPPDWD